MYKILTYTLLIYSSTNWNKEIRNGGVSTDCSGSSNDHEIVFGLNCTTFGCELNETHASRIATTVPLNITQHLNSSEPVPGNQSNTTVFTPELNICTTSVALMDDVTTSTEEEVMSTISYNPTPATSSIDSLLAEELEFAISNVSSIVSTLRHFHVFHCNPALDKWKGRLEGH